MQPQDSYTETFLSSAEQMENYFMQEPQATMQSSCKSSQGGRRKRQSEKKARERVGKVDDDDMAWVCWLSTVWREEDDGWVFFEEKEL